jgi:hypothetical protein
VTLAAILALLLAQVTPSPSPPTTTGSGTGQNATLLSLSDALTRLIPDAPNRFAAERGAKIVSAKGVIRYALNFGIVGLTDCAVMDTDSSFTMCVGYHGNDATTAHAAYNTLKAELIEFTKGRVSESASTATGTEQNTITITSALFRPNPNVGVTMQLLETKGSFLVLFSVASIPPK